MCTKGSYVHEAMSCTDAPECACLDVTQASLTFQINLIEL
jgi:hypothetical protein